LGLSLVVVDLDGTIIDRDGSIGTKTLQSLETARNMGLRVVVATGRAPRSALKPARLVDADSLVACNGAVACDLRTGDLWWAKTVPPRVVRLVVRGLDALSREVWPRVHTLNEVFVAEQDAVRARLYTSTYGEACRLVADRSRLARRAVMVGVTGPPDFMHAARELVQDAIGSLARVQCGNEASFDVVAPSVSKAWAVEQLANRLGVPRSEVAAFGDGPNDVELIAWAGVGVVVGPGCPEIRKVATRQAPQGDGVGEVLLELLRAQ